MRRGIVCVTAKALEEFLLFPEGHKIIDVVRDQRVHGRQFEFLVEGPQMPEVNEGDTFMQVNMTYHEARVEFEV